MDGNNGLLLSPHVDHLFDRGFITATNQGKLIVSSLLEPDTLERWGVEPSASFGAFRPEQMPYLDFHRKFVFKP